MLEVANVPVDASAAVDPQSYRVESTPLMSDMMRYGMPSGRRVLSGDSRCSFLTIIGDIESKNVFVDASAAADPQSYQVDSTLLMSDMMRYGMPSGRRIYSEDSRCNFSKVPLDNR